MSTTTPEHDQRIAKLTIDVIYPLYVEKIEKKGRTVKELNEVIRWLTGHNEDETQDHIDRKSTFEEFFKNAKLNPNAMLIKGVICGYRVEEITTPLTQQIRYLDKLVDELAKGKPMVKILRS